MIKYIIPEESDTYYYDSYEEARDNAEELIGYEALIDEFEDVVSYRELFQWAREQRNFWEDFEDAYCSVIDNLTGNLIEEVEVED
jgi:hypothetical protein